MKARKRRCINATVNATATSMNCGRIQVTIQIQGKIDPEHFSRKFDKHIRRT